MLERKSKGFKIRYIGRRRGLEWEIEKALRFLLSSECDFRKTTRTTQPLFLPLSLGFEFVSSTAVRKATSLVAVSLPR